MPSIRLGIAKSWCQITRKISSSNPLSSELHIDDFILFYKEVCNLTPFYPYSAPWCRITDLRPTINEGLNRLFSDLILPVHKLVAEFAILADDEGFFEIIDEIHSTRVCDSFGENLSRFEIFLFGFFHFNELFNWTIQVPGFILRNPAV